MAPIRSTDLAGRVRASHAKLVRATTFLLTVGLVVTAAWAQGSGSGEYGEVPLGGSVEGILAGIQGHETVVYHTYTVTIPPASGPVTVRVEGFGSDVDLALKQGAPILSYQEVDFIDISEEPDPIHTLEAPTAGTLYVDVMNLLPTPARYRLSVVAEAVVPAPSGTKAVGPGRDEPLLGTFEGDGLRVTVTGGAGDFGGELALLLSGQRLPFLAVGSAGRLDGRFVSDGYQFDFTAELIGDTLKVVTDGATFVARRLDPALNPILAEGAHAILTRDNAVAFVEALEFALSQAGFAVAVGEADRLDALEGLARGYAELPAPEQVVLAMARDVWTRVQENWAAADPSAQTEFVLGVLVLVYGEEAVQQAIAGSRPSGGGGAGGCDTVAECMANYAPEAYADTLGAQGCWAAAGCESYDADTNAFVYESYDQ